MRVPSKWICLLALLAALGSETYAAAPAAPLAAQSMKARGRVDDVSGKPIPNAEVVVVRVEWKNDAALPPKELAKTQSAADGSFTIDWPLDQDDRSWCYLRATANGFAHSWARNEPGTSGTGGVWLDEQRNVNSFEPRLTLLPECTLTGTVVNQLGQPLAGTTVSIHNARPTVTTDAQGRFSFNKLQPRSHEYLYGVNWMVFAHPDYMTLHYQPGNGSDRNILEIGKPLDMRIELKQGVVVRGRVTDVDTGRPHVGYAVHAATGRDGPNTPPPQWSGLDRTLVAADGTYQLRLPAGFTRLYLIKPDGGMPPEASAFYPVQDFVDVNSAQTPETKVDFQVKRGTAVSGRIKLPETVPPSLMRDISVSIYPAKRDNEVGPFSHGHFVSVNQNGEFTFPGVRPTEMVLDVRHKISGGEASPLKQNISVPADRPLPPLELTLPADKLLANREPAISGRVLLPDGKPAAHARVIYVPPLNPANRGIFESSLFTLTTADGTFSMPVPKYMSQDCRLYVRDATGIYAAVVSAKAAITPAPLDIKLIEGGRAKGRVLDGDGKPLAGWTVVYNRPNASWGGGGGGGGPYPLPRLAAAFTDAEGNYELTGLLPLHPADNAGIILTMDIMTTGSQGLPDSSLRDIPRYPGIPIAPGKTVDDINFQVLRTGRFREYQILPEAKPPQDELP